MDLPITGHTLTPAPSTPYALVLVAGPYELHIEGELAVRGPGGESLHRIPGEPHAEELPQALSGVVVAAEVDEKGALHVDLDTGRRLVVAPDRYFEAWHLSDPGRYLMVCMPGGELAVWSARD